MKTKTKRRRIFDRLHSLVRFGIVLIVRTPVMLILLAVGGASGFVSRWCDKSWDWCNLNLPGITPKKSNASGQTPAANKETL
jgi:hypothetical protein